MSQRNLKITQFALCLCLLAAACTFAARHEPRSERCGEIKNAPVVYLALGDSTGVGVGAEHGGYVERIFSRLSQARPRSQLFNRSASAATTGDVLQTQLADLPKIKPDLITVCVGADDLINSIRAEDFARNYGAIIARIKTQTSARVIVMNIPDLSLAPAVPAYMRADARRHIVAFNQLIAEVAARENVQLVDLFARSESFASHTGFFSKDGLHPSDEGYEFWAELLLPYVNSALDCH